MDFLVLLFGSQFSVARGDDVYGRFAGAQGRNQPPDGTLWREVRHLQERHLQGEALSF